MIKQRMKEPQIPKRLQIFKYKKSGKYVALSPKYKSTVVLDLDSTMSRIKQTRFSGINKDSIVKSDYILEVLESITPANKTEHNFDYKYLRVLSPDDISPDRWKNSASLEDLPVSSYPYISEEERIWAGERKGNMIFAIALLIINIAILWGLYVDMQSNQSIVGNIILLGISIYFVFKTKWKFSQKVDAAKINELKAYKELLAHQKKAQVTSASTEFIERLKDYSVWEHLSPENFELACEKYLKQKYSLDLKMTQYSGDGGVDLEGSDKEGNEVIVQAKKYSSNVGVAVVREMIGIRESRTSKPVTFIVALVGFTKGAIELAFQENIGLISIKNDLLKI
ncbi:restriction endonuclease [Candidatus Pseudothioglobus singularis]|nr:restriction endonuclease [Candidatus Pseudothioglobus singularis]